MPKTGEEDQVILDNYRDELSSRWDRRTVHFDPVHLQPVQIEMGQSIHQSSYPPKHLELDLPKAYALQPSEEDTFDVELRGRRCLRFRDENQRLRCWGDASMVLKAREAGVPWPVELCTRAKNSRDHRPDEFDELELLEVINRSEGNHIQDCLYTYGRLVHHYHEATTGSCEFAEYWGRFLVLLQTVKAKKVKVGILKLLQCTKVNEELAELRIFPSLWRYVNWGKLAKLIPLLNDMQWELVCGLRHIRCFWEPLSKLSAQPIDYITTDKLSGLYPGRCVTDSEKVCQLMDSNKIFVHITEPDVRSQLRDKIIGVNHRIPTLTLSFDDIAFLAHITSLLRNTLKVRLDHDPNRLELLLAAARHTCDYSLAPDKDAVCQALRLDLNNPLGVTSSRNAALTSSYVRSVHLSNEDKEVLQRCLSQFFGGRLETVPGHDEDVDSQTTGRRSIKCPPNGIWRDHLKPQPLQYFFYQDYIRSTGEHSQTEALPVIYLVRDYFRAFGLLKPRPPSQDLSTRNSSPTTTSSPVPASDSDSTLVGEDFDHHLRSPQALQDSSTQALEQDSGDNKFSLPMTPAPEDRLIQ